MAYFSTGTEQEANNNESFLHALMPIDGLYPAKCLMFWETAHD